MLFREMDDHDLLKVFAGLRMMVPRQRYRPAKTCFESISFVFAGLRIMVPRQRYRPVKTCFESISFVFAGLCIMVPRKRYRPVKTRFESISFVFAGLRKIHPVRIRFFLICVQLAIIMHPLHFALGDKRQFFTPDGQVTMSLARH